MQLECHACDTSPTALAHAQALADDAGVQLHTFRCDLTREAIDRPYDFITCSLFLHHLRREQAVALLASMQRSVRTCAVINDLNRCALGLALAWIGTRSLSRSPIVHADGPTSVRAAWTPDEV